MNISSTPSPLALSRREALGRILAATAFAASSQFRLFGVESAVTPIIGADPNLLLKEIPWPRLLSEAEKKAVAILGDLIIPADEFGPAASAVGVPDFIDEWVSAPYEQQVRERQTIRDGLTWLDAAAQKRFGKIFAEAAPEQQTALLEEIVTEGTEARQEGKTFFLIMRDRVVGGYYTTTVGWKALGYTGNAPQAEFPGPPPEVLTRLGLA